MKKSDFLDELRLEVGLAFDYAKSKDDFIQRILQGIHSFLKKEIDCCLTVYQVSKQGTFHIKSRIGMKRQNSKEQFAFGMINQTNFHTTVLLELTNKQILLVPIREGDLLKYVFKLQLNNYSHTYTNDDVAFVNEVVRFIEVRQKSFSNDDKR